MRSPDRRRSQMTAPQPEAVKPAKRPSPWTTKFARRTNVSGARWALGLLASWLSPIASEPGWLQIRLGLAGLLDTRRVVAAAESLHASGPLGHAAR